MTRSQFYYMCESNIAYATAAARACGVPLAQIQLWLLTK